MQPVQAQPQRRASGLTWLKQEAKAKRAGGRVSTSKGKRARTGELLAAGHKRGMRAQKTDDFFG